MVEELRPPQHLGVSELSSSVCSENNNWPGLCVFGLNQHVPSLIKGTVWICHPLYAHIRVKLLEERASDEYNGEGGIDSPLFGFDCLEISWLPRLIVNLILNGSMSPSLLSEFIFKSNCCRAHAIPAVGWSILGMHGGGKVSGKQLQGCLCTYSPGYWPGVWALSSLGSQWSDTF